jgi:hypothetical protein
MNAKGHSAAGVKPAGENTTAELRLSTARKRLAASCDPQDALEGLREIVGTFLGSEEIALFTVDSRTTSFEPFWWFGIDAEKYDLNRALGDAGRQRVMRGEYHVEMAGRDASGEEALGRAFVPIRVGGRIVAVLAILRLLPQKAGFDQSDFELFQMLTDEAGAPLFGRSVPPANDGLGKKA